MAALTALALGGALGLGILLGKKKKKPDYQLTLPTLDQQEPTQNRPATTPAQQVAATQPVNAVQAESQNIAGAQQAARGLRRRAISGSAGRRSTGAVSAGQSAIRAGGLPKSLIGF